VKTSTMDIWPNVAVTLGMGVKQVSNVKGANAIMPFRITV